MYGGMGDLLDNSKTLTERLQTSFYSCDRIWKKSHEKVLKCICHFIFPSFTFAQILTQSQATTEVLPTP